MYQDEARSVPCLTLCTGCTLQDTAADDLAQEQHMEAAEGSFHALAVSACKPAEVALQAEVAQARKAAASAQPQFSLRIGSCLSCHPTRVVPLGVGRTEQAWPGAHASPAQVSPSHVMTNVV